MLETEASPWENLQGTESVGTQEAQAKGPYTATKLTVDLITVKPCKSKQLQGGRLAPTTVLASELCSQICGQPA